MLGRAAARAAGRGATAVSVPGAAAGAATAGTDAARTGRTARSARQAARRWLRWGIRVLLGECGTAARGAPQALGKRAASGDRYTAASLRRPADRESRADPSVLERHAGDEHRLLGRTVTAAVDGALVADLLDGLEAGVVELAEDRVARRQRRLAVHHEELRAVGVRAGVGHREGAGRIGLGAAQLV